MNAESSIQSLVALSLLPRMNTRECLPILEKCGNTEGFFYEKENVLQKLWSELNCSFPLPDRKKAFRKSEEELQNIDKYDISLCSDEQANYPRLLKQCPDAPLVFYYKGKLAADKHKFLAVVGTRNASDHCKKRVESILQQLSLWKENLVIVSGLAYGIDISAHSASLKYDLLTYAILGHGLNMIYPASHKQIAEKILEKGGALITEFPCSARILPINFLQRNRIIAGLCHATLVAESAEKGGAMATARIAFSYNRDVMALPGRPEDKMSVGCNLLIKQNLAFLVENETDIAKIFGWAERKKESIQTSLDLFEDTDYEKHILKILKQKGGIDLDSLSRCSCIPVSELTALLLKMELEGKVLSLPGKNYILN